jgi:TM2 domain-containing membrane protein YozV
MASESSASSAVVTHVRRAWQQPQWTPFSFVIGGLLLAWFLSLFNLDRTLIGAWNEVNHTTYTTNVYWLTVVLICVLIGTIMWIRDLFTPRSKRTYVQSTTPNPPNADQGTGVSA